MDGLARAEKTPMRIVLGRLCGVFGHRGWMDHQMSESTSNEYSLIDAVNWSTLKWMLKSPAVYRYRLKQARTDTPALAMGRATHTLVFEPEKFRHEYAVWEGGDRRGNAWKEFQEENAGKTIFKPQEIDTAMEMADAVRSHPLVRPYLDGGFYGTTNLLDGSRN
jgi:hypothetical protein